MYAVNGNVPNEAQMLKDIQATFVFQNEPSIDSFEYAQEETIQEDSDLLSISSSELMDRVLEYARLAALPDLSDDQANRLGRLLEDANKNRILSFWFAEVDHFLGHYLNLLNEDNREHYIDQEASLRERLGLMDGIDFPQDEQVETHVCSERNSIVPCSRALERAHS